MDDLFQKAFEAAQKGQDYAFATIVECTIKGTPRKTGAKMIVLQDGTIYGTIGGGACEKAAQKDCLKALKTRKSTLVIYDLTNRNKQLCGGQMRVFIEPFGTPKHLIICGAGHIALPLSAFAKILNFKVTVVDDRKAYANKKRFPHVDKIELGQFSHKLSKMTLNPNTFIVIITYGHKHDFDCLKAVIKSKAAYIGVVASLAKRHKFLGNLKKMGLKNELLKRVQIPVGLDIGAQTPQEIAISIMAEIVALCNAQSVGSIKFKRKKS